MTQLARYEQARNALAECQRVDEVKDIRDKAEAMAAYARQAKDTEMIQWVTEIKVRAERRCGELLRGMKLRDGGSARREIDPSNHVIEPPTLADMGLTLNQSSVYQQLAAMPDEHFEATVATAKDTAGQVTTAFMLREAAKAKPSRPTGKPKTGPKAEAMREEIKAAQERGASMLCSYARLLIGAIQASEGLTEEERDLLDAVTSAIDSTKKECFA